MFNVGRVTQWAFTDGLRINPKADPETIGLAILILREVARPSLCQGTPRSIIDRELGGHCTQDGFYVHQAPLGGLCHDGLWLAENLVPYGIINKNIFSFFYYYYE